MAIIDNETAGQLKEIFTKMVDDIKIILFTTEGAPTCKETDEFVSECTAITEKIELIKYDLNSNSEEASKYGVDKVPAIVMIDGEGNNVNNYFYGIPAGHEINSFISSILEVSGAKQEIPEELVNRIKAIDKEIEIKVFIGLQCPHCPGAVINAHRLALINPKIKAEMIEASTFPELSEKYKVQGVPKIVINDDNELMGNQPMEAFIETMEKL